MLAGATSKLGSNNFFSGTGFAFPSGHATDFNWASSMTSNRVQFRKDEKVFGEDEAAEYVYQVIDGAVRSYKTLFDGRRHISSFHLPGDIFGLEHGATHRMNAEAVCAAEVRMIKRRNLDASAKSDASISGFLWTVTSLALQHAEDHMLLLGCKSAMERIAAFLLEMHRRLSTASAFALPMGRQDIGDYLGLTLETVSRAFRSLHERGVLQFAGARHIEIKNPKKLLELGA